MSVPSEMRQAVSLHQQGNLEEADLHYAKVLDQEPRHSEALRLRGILARQMGNLAFSIELLEAASKADQYDADALCELALSHMALGELVSAETALRKALVREEGSLKGLANLGALLQYRGHVREALDYHRRVLALTPDDLEVRANLIKCMADEGDVEAALQECDASLEETGGHPFVLATKGGVLCDLRRFEEAEHYLIDAVRQDPSNDMALVNLGFAHVHTGQKDLAVEALLQAMSYNPSNARAVSDLAALLTGMDKGGEALELCGRFLRRHPGERMVLSSYAYALREEGREKDANALLDFENLIHVIDVSEIEGFESLSAFNQTLAQEMLDHESLVMSPLNKATRGGGQTGELDFDESDTLHAFGNMLIRAVRETSEKLAQANVADHTLMNRAPDNWSLRAWGTVLEAGGHQLPHIHPLGWMSGVYYPQLPTEIGHAQHEEGYIEFGAPPDHFDLKEEAPTVSFEPKEGRLVLFPSYFYHRTKPFQSDKRRISLAFDVVPQGPMVGV